MTELANRAERRFKPGTITSNPETHGFYGRTDEWGELDVEAPALEPARPREISVQPSDLEKMTLVTKPQRLKIGTQVVAFAAETVEATDKAIIRTPASLFEGTVQDVRPDTNNVVIQQAPERPGRLGPGLALPLVGRYAFYRAQTRREQIIAKVKSRWRSATSETLVA